jgi:hypothetical protein
MSDVGMRVLSLKMSDNKNSLKSVHLFPNFMLYVCADVRMDEYCDSNTLLTSIRKRRTSGK